MVGPIFCFIFPTNEYRFRVAWNGVARRPAFERGQANFNIALNKVQHTGNEFICIGAEFVDVFA